MAEEELGKPQFDLGKPQFAYHATVEPIMIVGIMVIACYVNRRRDYAIFPRTTKADQGLLGSAEIDSLDGEDTSEDSYDGHDSPRFYYANLLTAPTHAPKTRTCMGTIIQTPNSSRFANNWHSRFIQKFPFLVEMFYWAVNLLFYVCVKACSELIFATDGVWQTAQKHGIAVLYVEHGSFLRFLFPIEEVTVQSFFREGHQSMLTILNRAYSLIHIPVTVSFLAWYYYAAPTHAQFAAARRMMTVTNFTSFIVFTAYPCMPPRLLPEEFGFYDTVRREDAESIYATNKFFNQLAAFPSLHFGYSFCIGTVLMYHSGLFRRRLLPRERRMSKCQQLFFATLSIVYPLFVLTIIVATANHYYLDALAATAVVLFAWVFNRVLLVLLPLEDMFLYCIKLEKPTPTTGSSLYRW